MATAVVNDWVPVKVGAKWFAQSSEGEKRPDGGLNSKKEALDFILKLADAEDTGKAGVLPPNMNKLNMGAPSGMPQGMPLPQMGGPAGGAPGVNPLMALMGK